MVTGCHHKKLKASDFADIRANMTEERVVKKLGAPDKVVKSADQARKIDKKEEEKSTDSFISKYPDSIIQFFKSKKEKKELLKKMKNSNDLYCYEYSYKEDNKEYKWHIYFIKNKVIWMTFP